MWPSPFANALPNANGILTWRLRIGYMNTGMRFFRGSAIFRFFIIFGFFPLFHLFFDFPLFSFKKKNSVFCVIFFPAAKLFIRNNFSRVFFVALFVFSIDNVHIMKPASPSFTVLGRYRRERRYRLGSYCTVNR
jgi:hypothetical protein